MNKFLTVSVVTFCLLMCSSGSVSQAGEVLQWTEGHGDIGLAYEEGWNLHIHAEGATLSGVEYDDVEFDPSQVCIVLPASTQTARPAGAEWNPVGVGSGNPFWLLPQTQTIGVPFVGFGTEEIPAGDFVGDQFDLRLIGVSSPGGAGNFSLYLTDAFGVPDFRMSTADGIDASDVLTLQAEAHLHANLAFSEPGLWYVAFEASGTHSVDGFVTGQGTYCFNVLPEPATAGGLLIVGLLAIRRRNR